MSKMPTIILSILLLGASNGVQAQGIENFKRYEELKIFFNAFPSTFISPDIAQSKNIIRGEKNGLVNIAVTSQLGLHPEMKVSGIASNIFQQRQKLIFKEIREGSAVYYLATFEYDNEDFFTFNITVQSLSDAKGHGFKFQKRMYIDS